MLVDNGDHDDVIDKGAKDSTPNLGKEHGSVRDLDWNGSAESNGKTRKNSR